MMLGFQPKTILRSENILLLVALILFVINIPRCFNGNFWLDETCTIYISKMSFGEVINNTIDYDMHPPLYYLIMSAVQKIFGNSVFAFHMVSLLMYAGILVYSATVIKNHFGKMAALILMILVTTFNTAFYFNTELRMYEMAMFVVLVSFVSLYSIMEGGGGGNHQKYDWYIFVISSLIAAYTYYYCLIIVAFFYFALLLHIIIKNKDLLKKFVIACTITVICYIPGAYYFYLTFKRGTSDFWIKDMISFKQMFEYFFESDLSKFLVLIFVLCTIFVLWQNYNHNKNDDKFSLKKYITNIDPESLWIYSD